MKKTAVILLIIPVLFCCGFIFKRREKPVILLSSNVITKDTAQVIENVFEVQSRIYLMLYSKDGFKYPAVRMQITKQDDKVSNWGFSLISAKNIYLDTSSNAYRDYIYLRQPGHYIVQFFYVNNKDYPFAHREFKVL